MMQYLGALEVAFPSEGVELAQIEREKHDGVKPIPDKGWNITNNEKCSYGERQTANKT